MVSNSPAPAWLVPQGNLKACLSSVPLGLARCHELRPGKGARSGECPSAGGSQAILDCPRQLVRGKLHARMLSLAFPMLWSSLPSWKEQRNIGLPFPDSWTVPGQAFGINQNCPPGSFGGGGWSLPWFYKLLCETSVLVSQLEEPEAQEVPASMGSGEGPAAGPRMPATSWAMSPQP